MTSDVRHRMSRPYTRALSTGLPLMAIILLGGVVTLSAEAQTFTLVYEFKGGTGAAYPGASLTRDAAGNLYGTTAGGGIYNYGTVFKLDTAGKETVLHSFSGSDGKNPVAALVRDGTGNLYGTALTGGTFDYGTVFKLNTAGKFKVLHSFAGADGRIPQAGLIFDAAGNLYGTTAWGGAYDNGTVFRLDRITGQEIIVHSFNVADGAVPLAGLIRDRAGNFYGTTNSGGAFDKGTVFKLDVTGNEVVLYSFRGVPDGQAPYGGLVLDSAGNLYGTTANGGDEGFGTVFKLDVTGTETILHTFRHRADGESPQAGLLRDAKGNLYGTTVVGGSGLDDGTVFELDANGNYKMLHIFTGADGDRPSAALIRGAAGDFYGTTGGGGLGYGVVFKLAR